MAGRRPAALLFNPTAGQGRGARRFADVVDALRTGFELEVLPTASADELLARARDGVQRELDTLFVLGGDGTLRLAAGELAGSATALGPLPGGTTNVVACAALGLPADPAAAAAALVGGSVREMDAGSFHGPAGDGLFLMQLSGGFDARVLAAVDPGAKRRFGKLAIAWAGLRLLVRDRFPPFALELDGVPTTATGFVVANLPEYAGRFEIVPGARADDGELDLLLFHGANRRAALGFAAALARGRHARRADVELRRARSVVVTAPPALLLQADGDPFAAAPRVEIGLSPHRLRLLAPTPERGPASAGAR